MPEETPSPEEVRMLKEIAKLGGLKGHVAISSGELAKHLGVSQQTSSRRILDLLHKGYIVRRMGMRRQLLRVAPLGVEALRAEFEDYKTIFQHGVGELEIHGVVVEGLGEGQYYMSRKGYREAFNKLLGFDPHPGTLNLRLEDGDTAKLEDLRSRSGLLIPEFVDENRTFGAVKCFPSTIRGVECAVVLPVRSHHADILEVISPHRLREKLDISDGDRVTVAVEAKG